MKTPDCLWAKRRGPAPWPDARSVTEIERFTSAAVSSHLAQPWVPFRLGARWPCGGPKPGLAAALTLRLAAAKILAYAQPKCKPSSAVATARGHEAPPSLQGNGAGGLGLSAASVRSFLIAPKALAYRGPQLFAAVPFPLTRQAAQSDRSGVLMLNF